MYIEALLRRVLYCGHSTQYSHLVFYLQISKHVTEDIKGIFIVSSVLWNRCNRHRLLTTRNLAIANRWFFSGTAHCTTQCSMSVEIFLTATQLNEKSHLKKKSLQ